MSFELTIRKWILAANKAKSADLIAGLTLWALVVPQSIAYANLAGAPSPIAGLYCIIIVLPIYALFASSMLLVPSPTTAVSATFAGFLVAMSSDPQAALSALVMGTAIGYFIFYFFKLGFLTEFISAPVSMGYLSGLSIMVIIGQFPILLGYSVPRENVFAQVRDIYAGLGGTNNTTALLSFIAILLFLLIPKLTKKLPAGLVVLLLAILVSWQLNLEGAFGVEMVGALPQGLPKFSLTAVNFNDLAIIIPASIGLVILASGEASVTAEILADKNGQRVNMNRQFFAFGMGNLAGSLFGAVLGTGASSASMVNSDAGAKTPMSLIWAALAALVTLMFFTGLFAYVPSAFLSALVIVSVWKMLAFRKIWRLRGLAKSEYFLALLAQVSVLVFGILNGLLLSMLINVLYYAYVTSRIQTTLLGRSRDHGEILVPLSKNGTVKLPDDVLALGSTEGSIFYASARLALTQASDLIKMYPDSKRIVLSLARMGEMDYTSYQIFYMFISEWLAQGKTLYLTDVRSAGLMKQLHRMDFDINKVHISDGLDLDAL